MNSIHFIILCLLLPLLTFGQQSSTEFPTEQAAEQAASMADYSNKDARFYRPTTFKHKGDKGTFSIGGYADANTQFFITDGEGEGLKFQFRDFHLITQSSFLNDRLHFIADIGFTPATKQFNLTEAALNIKFHEAFNLRGGVIKSPIGYFNQWGDSPLNNFIDAPLSSTTIIPAKHSEAGFGVHGTVEIADKLDLTYELYGVNGLQEGIVENDIPRTSIDLGTDANPFGADNNSKLAVTSRVGLQLQGIGELGVSYYRGAYNVTEIDETEVDDSRAVAIFALDGRAKIQKLSLLGELALAQIDIYEGLGQLFASKQMGYHIEANYPILENFKLLDQTKNSLDLALRLESADYNVGKFEQTGTKIYDERIGVRAGLSLRLAEWTVIKANYSYFWNKDILGNASKTGGIQFGFASYF